MPPCRTDACASAPAWTAWAGSRPCGRGAAHGKRGRAQARAARARDGRSARGLRVRRADGNGHHACGACHPRAPAGGAFCLERCAVGHGHPQNSPRQHGQLDRAGLLRLGRAPAAAHAGRRPGVPDGRAQERRHGAAGRHGAGALRAGAGGHRRAPRRGNDLRKIRRAAAKRAGAVHWAGPPQRNLPGPCAAGTPCD